MAHIGLDVGYGSRRSCGLAVLVARPALGAIFPHRKPYVRSQRTNSGGIVEAVTLLKDELLTQVADLRRLLNESVLVVDGMLAPGGKPTSARPVDSACMTGAFQNRAVPASVEGGGKRLVDATYEILEAMFLDSMDGRPAFTPASARQRPGPRVLETNPTIGLATCVRMIEDTMEIPSRHTGGGHKSDFYWEIGGGTRVAAVLGAQTVAAEKNHGIRSGG